MSVPSTLSGAGWDVDLVGPPKGGDREGVASSAHARRCGDSKGTSRAPRGRGRDYEGRVRRPDYEGMRTREAIETAQAVSLDHLGSTRSAGPPRAALPKDD